ncbi:30S ribosomal protein S20 [Candidatus Fermentibacteria bacterium]|nr:30S ribosomal protein S20 [Candidatus Fermentibacteria bacterium]
MPHHKAQAKSLRSDARKHLRNKSVKSNMRGLVRKLRETTDHEEAAVLLPRVVSAIDKAAKKGVIKQGTAVRNKSRLSKYVAGLTA